MKRTVVIITALVMVLGLVTSPVSADAPPLRIAVVGDSITAPCGDVPLAGWCATFDSLLTNAGVPHVILNHAIGGVSCQYWANHISEVVNDHPDLVLLNCGTNDDANATCYGEACVGWAWRVIVEQSFFAGAKVAVSFIGYSNPEIQTKAGRSWLIPNEPRVNDIIYRNYVIRLDMITALADFQQIPGNWSWLNGGMDGIHPNDHGAQAMAIIWYLALEGAMGWPDIVKKPCDMWGHRPGDDPPTYTPCVGLT